MISTSYRLLCLLSSTLLLIILLLVPWPQVSYIENENSSPTPKWTRRTPSKGPNAPPVLAYWILGSKGDNARMLRLLKAIYHPRNEYLLQLDSSSSTHQRWELVAYVNSKDSVFGEFGNVNVVGKSNGVNQLGASGLAALLHASSLLMKISTHWDWFIPLSASDYPLSPQDDILYAFGKLPREVNFVSYYPNSTAANKSQIAVDPTLYLTHTSPIFYASETREDPDAFQIFQGSPWMILSRSLLEYCIEGLDNLPRKLLMYFNNVAFPLQSYFHTILCNTPHFHNNTFNHTLMRYNMHDHLDPSLAPSILATPFKEDDPWLRHIDEQLLNRHDHDLDGIVPGKWRVEGDIDVVEETNAGIRLSTLLSRIAKNGSINGICV